METKICKVCGRELPETSFRLTKGEVRAATCNACITEKRAQTRYERAQVGGGQTGSLFRPGLRQYEHWRSRAPYGTR